MKAKVKQLVTADGTYATQSALLSSGGSLGGAFCQLCADDHVRVRNAGGPSKKNAQDPYADRPALRRFLLNGDFFVAATLGSILVKLCTRYMQLKVVCMFFVEELTTYKNAGCQFDIVTCTVC